MKATPIVLQILAISIVAILLIPQFVKAEVLSEQEIILNAPSVNQSEYDETVNIANDSAKQNAQTWDPTYEGVWVGGSTKESLFKFNQVTTDYSTLSLSWEAVFSTNQIMNGASTLTVRLPIYSSSDDIYHVLMSIYKIPTTDSYSFSASPAISPPTYVGVDVTFTDPANTYLVWETPHNLNTFFLHPSDTQITDGDDYYTIDNRMYVTVRAPIIPNERYLFLVEAVYKTESRFKVYFSPNDVVSDGILVSHISRYVITAPDTASFYSSNYSIDLGFSFDFRTGIGGNVVSKDFYLNAGDTIFFSIFVPGGNQVYGYHSIMIPFRTENGTAAFQGMAIEPVGEDQLWVRDTLTIYRDYVFACSNSQENVSSTDWEASVFQIMLVSSWDQRVSFIFEDLPYSHSGDTSDRSRSIITANITETTEIQFWETDVSQFWGMRLYCSYLITDNYIETPEIASLSAWDEKYAHENEKSTFWDELGFCLLVAGSVLLATATFLLAPIILPAVVAGLAIVAILNYYKSDIINAAGGLWNSITGGLRNILDTIWNGLKAIGEFLWSVGEFIYNVLKWAYEMIVEYGTIILGLLIIGVAMLLFFYPIHYQLKLWKVVLFMAQGRLDQADALMMSTAREGARDIRYAGRVGRRAYRRGSKGFSGMADRFRRKQ